MNLHSIHFGVMCFCDVLSRLKRTPPSTSWGCQCVIHFSYPELTFGIKRWKLLCFMKHFSQSPWSSREQVLQNTVNGWRHDTSNSSNGSLCSIPKFSFYSGGELGTDKWSVRDGGSLNCLAGQEHRWHHWRVRCEDFSYLTFPCLAFCTSSKNSIPVWIKGTTF